MQIAILSEYPQLHLALQAAENARLILSFLSFLLKGERQANQLMEHLVTDHLTNP